MNTENQFWAQSLFSRQNVFFSAWKQLQQLFFYPPKVMSTEPEKMSKRKYVQILFGQNENADLSYFFPFSDRAKGKLTEIPLESLQLNYLSNLFAFFFSQIKYLIPK